MANIFRNLDISILTNMLISIIPALLCITIHELSHGYVAYRLGDNTAKDMGRLTLNPIKHIDVIGIIMMVVVGFGWAKPVPVNMRNFSKPKQYMAITAIAGPISNILLAVVIFFIYGLIFSKLSGPYATSTGTLVLQIVSRMGSLSVALAVFNIIPIPPLDGSKVLFALLPDSYYMKLMRYERYGMLLLIVFVWSDLFSATFGKATTVVYDFLSGISIFAYSLVR